MARKIVRPKCAKAAKKVHLRNGDKGRTRDLAVRDIRGKKESHAGSLPKKRRKVALCFLALCAACFALLGLQSTQESDKEISALEYLADNNNAELVDPLGLTQSICDLRLLGVSADGKTLGYESDLSARAVSQKIIADLESKGWALDKDSDITSGFINMYQAEKSSSQASYILMQIIDIGAGSSIVISRW